VRIEEAAAVVKLDLPRRGKACESELDLLGNRAGRNAFGQRVAPQIAHQTPPGALPVGEKDGRDRNDLAGGCTLLLHEEGVRLPRIHVMAVWTLIEYPAVSFRSGLRIGG
jgi:hypothetical protein